MNAQHLFDSILNANNFSAAITFLAPDICSYLSCERITLYQKTLDDKEIVSRFKTGAEHAEIRVPLSTNSIAGYVALSHLPLYFDDVYLDAELQKSHPNLKFDKSFDQQSGFRTKAMITVPIKSHGVLLGVLQILNKTPSGVFSNLEARRALLLADVIGQKFSRDLKATQSPYEYLVKNTYLSHEQLQNIESRAAKNKVHASQLLINELQIDPAIIGLSLENFYQYPYQPFDPEIKLPQQLLSKVSKSYLRKQLCLPIIGNEQKAVVIIDNPNDSARILELQKALSIETMVIKIALPVDILRFLDADISSGDSDLSQIAGELREEAEVINDPINNKPDYDLGYEEAPIIKLVNKIIFTAVTMGASDIHLEPGREGTPTKVRMRVDGICKEIETIPAKYCPSVLSRIKVLARLDIAEHRKPQDGKCKLKFPSRTVELRVATLPTVNGESAVLRILSNAEALPINKLNLSPHIAKKILGLIEQPHGIFLVVGPTGSGKTTTLHALLGHLNTPEKKIWTIEDPVEITQAGLQQVQVTPKIGFNFSDALRSFLRADPDIILVGEMRDPETARSGIEASLTGHLVFSTLHTNSAPETITRLLDLGVDPLNFADALLGVLAQRLIRTLCIHCKRPYHPATEEIDKLTRLYGKNFLADIDLKLLQQQLLRRYGEACFSHLDMQAAKVILFQAQGCEKCEHTGYKGRMGIHELLCATPRIKALITRGVNISEIRNMAMHEGMLTLAQDGVLKILNGHTDLYQLHRIVTL